MFRRAQVSSKESERKEKGEKRKKKTSLSLVLFTQGLDKREKEGGSEKKRKET